MKFINYEESPIAELGQFYYFVFITNVFQNHFEISNRVTLFIAEEMIF